jgi:hypothetical protein
MVYAPIQVRVRPPPKRVHRSPSAASKVVNFLQDYVERQDAKERERAKKQEKMHDQKMYGYKGMLELKENSMWLCAISLIFGPIPNFLYKTSINFIGFSSINNY